MPHEFEQIIPQLEFVLPDRREITAQLLLDPPHRASLPWLIEVFRGCTTVEGWLDPGLMRRFLSQGLIRRTFTKTADSYIRVVENNGVNASPQLRVAAAFEAVLLTDPVRAYTVNGANDFLLGRNKWGRDFTGRRRRLLEYTYQTESGLVLPARNILAEAIKYYQGRIAA